MTSRGRSRLILTCALLAMCAFGIALGFIAYSVSIPMGSPKARMNRTEAGLAVLVAALLAYKTDFGDYPPAGDDGLRMATNHLSRNVDFLPDNQAFDGWDRPYVYVPSSEYARPGLGALEDHGAYFAPDSYQLYSVGMDGDAGVNSIAKRADNITSWETDHPWWQTYQRRHREFFRAKGTRQ